MSKKETATVRARLYPSTMKNVKVKAAKIGPQWTIAKVIDEQDKLATFLSNKGRGSSTTISMKEFKRFESLLKKSVR